MRWRSSAVLAVILAGIALSGCSRDVSPWPAGTKGRRVLVSFPPLYSFAKSVAGDDAAVLTLLTNQGPHEYELQRTDVLMLREADVFFVNGLNLDDEYTEKMRNSCGNAKLEYIALGRKVPKEQLIALGKEIRHGDHVHRGYDPHVWLGIPEATEMVRAIHDELKKIDPAHGAGYDERAEKFINELKQLQDDGLKNLERKEIKVVSFHGALSYFARSFHLKVVDSLQSAAGRDPSVNELRDVAKKCVEEGVRIIATEPQYPESRRLAENVIEQIQRLGKPAPKIISIDPLETADAMELDAGWYIRKMRENIQQVADAVK
jgi:ABC-type Zn uptake system ZnuABC Zn-binding protein ZnuA